MVWSPGEGRTSEVGSAVRVHYSDYLVSRSHPVAAQNTGNLTFGPPIVYVTDARFDEIGAADDGTPEGRRMYATDVPGQGSKE